MRWSGHVESMREGKLKFMGKDGGMRFLQNVVIFFQNSTM